MQPRTQAAGGSREATKRGSREVGTAAMRNPISRCYSAGALVEKFEAEFFDDGIGEDVFGDAFDLRLGLFAAEAVEGENEEFALADVFDFVVAERRESALNRLALRIEDRGFQHDPDVCFHARNYIRPRDLAAERKSSR